MLAAHDAVEAQRRVVGGQADAHRLPARAQQRRAPSRASPARRRRRGRGRRRAPRSRRARPRAPRRRRRRPRARRAPARARAAASWGSSDRHVRDARQQRGLQRHEPDRPAPMTTARATGRRPARGARRARRWPAAPPARRRARARRRAARRALAAGACTRSAKAPSWCTPISVRSRAQVLLARAAQPAAPAARQRVDGDARALPRAGAVAGRDDHARRTRGP